MTTQAAAVVKWQFKWQFMSWVHFVPCMLLLLFPSLSLSFSLSLFSSLSFNKCGKMRMFKWHPTVNATVSFLLHKQNTHKTQLNERKKGWWWRKWWWGWWWNSLTSHFWWGEGKAKELRGDKSKLQKEEWKHFFMSNNNIKYILKESRDEMLTYKSWWANKGQFFSFSLSFSLLLFLFVTSQTWKTKRKNKEKSEVKISWWEVWEWFSVTETEVSNTRTPNKHLKTLFEEDTLKHKHLQRTQVKRKNLLKKILFSQKLSPLKQRSPSFEVYKCLLPSESLIRILLNKWPSKIIKSESIKSIETTPAWLLFCFKFLSLSLSLSLFHLLWLLGGNFNCVCQL